MSGRGRGRGRGRGSSSIDFHQLGFGAGEPLPAPVLQPPPTFPPLEFKPVPLKQGPEGDTYTHVIKPLKTYLGEYMIALKRDFVEYLRYLHSQKQMNDASSSIIERFSDKYQSTNTCNINNWELQFHWDRFPLELHPKLRRVSAKRKIMKNGNGSKEKKAAFDISCKLDELAKLEEKDGDESDEPKEAEEKEQGEENEEDVVGDEEDDDDDEMDDGTDYLNNYFDNGESYFEDEDDKLDDGPVY